MDAFKKHRFFEERLEAKIDWIANNLNPLDYERFSKNLEKQYPKK